MSDNQVYRYGMLRSPKTSIRLAQILPGTGRKGVAINLVDAFVTGPQRIQYDALSYTWGLSERSKSISCNGLRLPVTPTLLEALQRFRHSDKIVTLWIDQICIDQARIKERNQQVQMMGTIFKSARKVVVWLGGDYDDSQAGMTLARQLLGLAESALRDTDAAAVPGLPKRGDRKWKALAAVLRRPWFWRTWIVQEVVLNPNVELVLGRNTLTWRELETVVEVLEGPLEDIYELDQAVSAAELPFSRINRIRRRHKEMVVPGHGLMSEHDPELLDLLLMSRSLGATDPRDKLYALLGLSKHEINPDYERSAEHVFVEFATHQVGAVTKAFATASAAGLQRPSSQAIEVQRAFMMFACAGRQNQQLHLPSWVPDWTVDLQSRPLIFGLGLDERFCAGGTELGTFDWDFDIGLQLSGVLLDTVQAVGSVKLDFSATAGPYELIAEWWQEAQQIALGRIARSPGSTAYTDAFEAMRRRLKLCRHGYYLGEPTRKRRRSLLDEDDFDEAAAHSASQTLTLGPTRGRVMFASTVGYLGLAPRGTLQGDVIFVVRGAAVPYIMRPQGRYFELIGEAYCQGVMGGEALDMAGLMAQDIVIR